MVGGRPTVDLPQAVRAWIEARTGGAVFVAPDSRTFSGAANVGFYPTSQDRYPRDVPFRDVEPEARLELRRRTVREESGQLQ
jgi:hypothetical protein